MPAELQPRRGRSLVVSSQTIVESFPTVSHTQRSLRDIRQMRVARRAFLEVVIRDHPDWEQRELANFIGCSQGTIHQDLVSIRRASAQASPATKPLLEPELTLRERLVVQLMNAHPNWTNEEIMEEIAARERKLR